MVAASSAPPPSISHPLLNLLKGRTVKDVFNLACHDKTCIIIRTNSVLCLPLCFMGRWSSRACMKPGRSLYRGGVRSVSFETYVAKMTPRRCGHQHNSAVTFSSKPHSSCDVWKCHSCCCKCLFSLEKDAHNLQSSYTKLSIQVTKST